MPLPARCQGVSASDSNYVRFTRFSFAPNAKVVVGEPDKHGVSSPTDDESFLLFTIA